MIPDKPTSSTRRRSKKSTDNLTLASNPRKEALKFCSPNDGTKKLGDSFSDGSKTTEPLIISSRTNSQRSAGKNSIETASNDPENASLTKTNVHFHFYLVISIRFLKI